MTQLYLTGSNKVPNRVPYMVVANLHPTKYSWPPSEEEYCAVTPMKIRNSDSVVDHCVFTSTIE